MVPAFTENPNIFQTETRSYNGRSQLTLAGDRISSNDPSGLD